MAVAGLVAKGGVEEQKTSHLVLLIQVRWQLFLNSFQRRNRGIEVAIQTIGMIFVAMFALGTSVGFYFGTWAAVSKGQLIILNILLWAAFLVWQLGPVLFEGFSPGLNFREIARYPVSFPVYCFLNSAYGLLDPAAAVALLWMLAMWAGITTARPSWALPAALLLLIFAALNICCNRVVIGWLERFQSTRRGREIMVAVLLVVMLTPQIFQFINFQRIARSASGNPLLHVLAPINQMSPPGVVFDSLSGEGGGRAAPLILLAVYSLLVFILMVRQSRAIYQGEIYSEGSAHRRERLKLEPGWKFPGLDSPMSAIMEKEIRYLRQNLRLMVALAYPLIIFLLFFVRRGPFGVLSSGGRGTAPFFTHVGAAGLLAMFAGFTVLATTNVASNIFGLDQQGFGRWLLSPLPLQKVIFAKNLGHGLIFSTMYLVIAIGIMMSRPVPLLWFISISIGFFAVLIIQLAAGNLFSAYWPKRVDLTQMNSRMASNAAGYASFLVIIPVGIIGMMVVGATSFWDLPWLPVVISAGMLALALKLYSVFLNRATAYMYNHLEEMESALSKQN